MAAVAGRQYGQGAVYGSLAYDFDNPELYREEYSRPRTPAAKPQTHTYSRVRTCTKVVARSRQGISPVSVLGLFVAAVMFVISITAQIALFDVSSESVALSKELAVLEEEQARLRIAYERAFNLSEVETYARKRWACRNRALTRSSTSTPLRRIRPW